MDPIDHELVSRTECLDIARKCLEKHKILDFQLVTYEVQHSIATGGFTGQYYTLTVQVIVDDNTPKTLNFFIKAPPPINTLVAAYVEENGHFEKEVYIYNNIFPKLLKNLDRPIVPECYLAIPKRIIVLEDLRNISFVMVDKMVPLELDHCKVVLIALAKFHAKSMIFEETCGKSIHDEFSQGIFEVWYSKKSDRSVQKYWTTIRGLIYLVDRIDKFDKTAKAKFKDKIEEIAENHTDYLLPSKMYKNVISHGDLWVNNILFRMQNDGKPDACSFVDYQLLRYTPPAVDILYFLQCSTTRKFRQQHSTELYQLYHKTLSDALIGANLDPKTIFPIEDFLESIKSFGCSSLFHCIINLPATLLSGKKIAEEYHGQMNDAYLEHIVFEDRSSAIRSQFDEIEAYRERMIDAVGEFYDEFVM